MDFIIFKVKKASILKTLSATLIVFIVVSVYISVKNVFDLISIDTNENYSYEEFRSVGCNMTSEFNGGSLQEWADDQEMLEKRCTNYYNEYLEKNNFYTENANHYRLTTIYTTFTNILILSCMLYSIKTYKF